MPDVPNGTRCNMDIRAQHVDSAKVGFANVSLISNHQFRLSNVRIFEQGRIILGSAWYDQDPVSATILTGAAHETI